METFYRNGFRFEYPSHPSPESGWVDITLPGGRQFILPSNVLTEFMAVWHTAASREATDGRNVPPPGWGFLSHNHFRKPLNGGRCFYRTGRGSRADPQWDAFKPGTVCVIVREYDVPTTHRNMTRYWRKGEPSEVGVRELHDNWVVYTPDDLDESGDGILWLGDGVAERGDYLLQILLPTI